MFLFLNCMHTGTAMGQQWALGGDTWVAGCRIPDCTILPDFNQLNPDMQDEKLSTELGVYNPHCGLENVKFAYGHDEYMYHMMVRERRGLLLLMLIYCIATTTTTVVIFYVYICTIVIYFNNIDLQ